MEVKLNDIDMALGVMNTINAIRERDLKDGFTHTHEEKKLEVLLETIDNMFTYHLIGVEEWNYLHDRVKDEMIKRRNKTYGVESESEEK